MKKFVLGLFLLIIFFPFLTPKVSAAENCPDGYTYNPTAGTCLNDNIGQVAEGAAGATCDQLLFTSMGAASPFMPYCRDKFSQAYKDVLASRPQIEGVTGTTFCISLGVSQFISGFSTIPGLYDWTIDACAQTFSDFARKVNSMTPLEVPATGSHRTTISVYDPACGGFDPDAHTGFTGVKTALGCLPTDPQEFVKVALPWAIYLGAGIAFLLGVFGALMIVLSAGNPEKMQAGKEMITSAIGGVVILAFAIFLLDFIGVKVLKLFSF